MSEVDGAVIDSNVLAYDLVEDSVYHFELVVFELFGSGIFYNCFYGLVWVLKELIVGFV